MNCLTNTRVPLLVRVLSAGSVALAVFATADRSQAADLLYPDKTWQQATPADVGMDSEQLDRVRRYALSDYRILQSKETAPGTAEVTYEVAGEIGVTRVLKRKAVAVRKGGRWKISDLGM